MDHTATVNAKEVRVEDKTETKRVILCPSCGEDLTEESGAVVVARDEYYRLELNEQGRIVPDFTVDGNAVGPFCASCRTPLDDKAWEW